MTLRKSLNFLSLFPYLSSEKPGPITIKYNSKVTWLCINIPQKLLTTWYLPLSLGPNTLRLCLDMTASKSTVKTVPKDTWDVSRPLPGQLHHGWLPSFIIHLVLHPRVPHLHKESQLYCTILYKRLMHSRILVSAGGGGGVVLEPVPLVITTLPLLDLSLLSLSTSLNVSLPQIPHSFPGLEVTERITSIFWAIPGSVACGLCLLLDAGGSKIPYILKVRIIWWER